MHVALLRGINVGGKNVIRMRDLERAFTDMGFTEVRTYIQSGNVLFRDDGDGLERTTERIEEGLAERFGYDARVIVRSKRQYLAALKHAPASWGEDASRKHNALFVRRGIRTSAVMAQLPPLQDSLEEAAHGSGVIFWSASITGIGRTTMMKLATLPVYKQLTVRNHRTTLRLRDLLTG